MKEHNISINLQSRLKDALMDQFMPRFKIDFDICNFKYILSLSYLHNGVWYERTASLDEEVKDKIEDGYNFTIEDGVVVLGKKVLSMADLYENWIPPLDPCEIYNKIEKDNKESKDETETKT